MRERLLLVKQFRISVLERRLEQIDQGEERPLFLGSLKRDRNPDRQSVLSELDTALADYGTLFILTSSSQEKIKSSSSVNLRVSICLAIYRMAVIARRQTILTQIHADALLERNARIFRLTEATKKNRLSLVNWINGNGSISRSETSFLTEKDLCASEGLDECKLLGVENVVECVLIWVYQKLKGV